MRPKYRDAIRIAAVVLIVCVGTGGHLFGQSVQATPVTDAAVRASIDKAITFLYSRQKPDGSIPNRHSAEYAGGGEALTVYALLTAGKGNDPRLHRTLKFLNVQQPGHTYTRSLRAIVYSHLANPDYRARLTGDVRWLTEQQHANGGWGYGPASTMTRLTPRWTDASNSQFALLALREASDAGIVVSRLVWLRAAPYWRKLQNTDGGWGYQPSIAGKPPQRPNSYGSMTAAGVATYFILADKLVRQPSMPVKPDERRKDARSAHYDQIGRGILWLGTNYRIDRIPRYVWMTMEGQLYYYLFCLQRVGDAAGIRTLGGRDYAAEICRLLVGRQKPNGSWNDSVIDTSFALLCLAKASSPVVIYRLDAGKGNARDTANLARWLSREFDRPTAWRQVKTGSSADFSGISLLYVNNSRSTGKTPVPRAMAEKFKRFIRNGGTCLVQAKPGDAKFVESVQKYCLDLFPDYRRQEIGPDHPVFSLHFKIPLESRRGIVGIGDGCRTRIFILTDDVSGPWDQGRFSQFKHLFQLGGNIVLYAGGGGLPPGRLAQRLKPSTPPPVKRYIKIARLKYDGDYNVCPLAIRRLGDELAHSLPIGLKELTPADPSGRIDPNITLLWLTGNAPPKFSRGQLANIRRYLEAGGTLLIDPAIGRSDFHAAAEKLIAAIFGRDNVRSLATDSPIITGQFADGIGADVRKVRLVRTKTIQSSSRPADDKIPPVLLSVVLKGRIAVVLSEYGLTCSVESNPCVENFGYVTTDARRIALNVILYAATTVPR